MKHAFIISWLLLFICLGWQHSVILNQENEIYQKAVRIAGLGLDLEKAYLQLRDRQNYCQDYSPRHPDAIREFNEQKG